jgi:hypothetical protein
VKLPNIKFHENPLSGFGIVTCGEREKDRDVTMLIGAFLQLFIGNVPISIFIGVMTSSCLKTGAEPNPIYFR